MTENVENAIFEILKKIQGDAHAFRVETNERFDRLNECLDRHEDIMRKQRRDVAGILVIGKSTAGTFAESLAALEKRVKVLEANRT